MQYSWYYANLCAQQWIDSVRSVWGNAYKVLSLA